jgi:hypothetical protein
MTTELVSGSIPTACKDLHSFDRSADEIHPKKINKCEHCERLVKKYTFHDKDIVHNYLLYKNYVATKITIYRYVQES